MCGVVSLLQPSECPYHHADPDSAPLSVPGSRSRCARSWRAAVLSERGEPCLGSVGAGDCERNQTIFTASCLFHGSWLQVRATFTCKMFMIEVGPGSVWWLTDVIKDRGAFCLPACHPRAAERMQLLQSALTDTATSGQRRGPRPPRAAL